MLNLALDGALLVVDVEVAVLGEEEDPYGEEEGDEGLADEANDDLRWLVSTGWGR